MNLLLIVAPASPLNGWAMIAGGLVLIAMAVGLYRGRRGH